MSAPLPARSHCTVRSNATRPWCSTGSRRNIRKSRRWFGKKSPRYISSRWDISANRRRRTAGCGRKRLPGLMRPFPGCRMWSVWPPVARAASASARWADGPRGMRARCQGRDKATEQLANGNGVQSADIIRASGHRAAHKGRTYDGTRPSCTNAHKTLATLSHCMA